MEAFWENHMGFSKYDYPLSLEPKESYLVCAKKKIKVPIYPLQEKVKNNLKWCHQPLSICVIIKANLSSSLDSTIFMSLFRSSDGCNDLIGGLDKVFTEINKTFHHYNINSTQINDVNSTISTLLKKLLSPTSESRLIKTLSANLELWI